MLISSTKVSVSRFLHVADFCIDKPMSQLFRLSPDGQNVQKKMLFIMTYLVIQTRFLQHGGFIFSANESADSLLRLEDFCIEKGSALLLSFESRWPEKAPNYLYFDTSYQLNYFSRTTGLTSAIKLKFDPFLISKIFFQLKIIELLTRMKLLISLKCQILLQFFFFYRSSKLSNKI